jgi:copper chaperone CopZ
MGGAWVMRGTDDTACNVCGQVGTKVLRVTMGVHVKEDKWPQLSQGFRFCWTPDCDVVYYNNERGIYFRKEDVKTRVGLKETTYPRPVCYCMNVTEERISEEILEKKCCSSLEDIKAYTRAGEGKWCLTTNPTGRCCREYLVRVIDKYLSEVNAGLAGELRQMEEDLAKAEEHRVTMKIEGLTCAGCVGSVAAALEEAGAKGAELSLKKGTAVAVVRDPKLVDKLLKAVEDAGYRAKILKIEKS